MSTKHATASEWSFYLPDHGETKNDAVPIIGRIWDFDHAAQEACEYDFSSRDGWERGEVEFRIAVVAPDGETRTFVAWHEPSVEHRVRPAP